MKYARCDYLVSVTLGGMWLRLGRSDTSWPSFPALPGPGPGLLRASPRVLAAVASLVRSQEEGGASGADLRGSHGISNSGVISLHMDLF